MTCVKREVNLTYEDGFSALMYASRFGNPDCVDILVKASSTAGCAAGCSGQGRDELRS